MGKIHANFMVINRRDQIKAEDGYIQRDEIRKIEIKGAIVDTGATTLCLPQELISELGLRVKHEVEVMTAAGIRTTRIYEDAKISIFDREGTFECIELPGGSDVLFGVIPLEMLGIELNLQKQKLRLLPMGKVRSYLTVY